MGHKNQLGEESIGKLLLKYSIPGNNWYTC